MLQEAVRQTQFAWKQSYPAALSVSLRSQVRLPGSNSSIELQLPLFLPQNINICAKSNPNYETVFILWDREFLGPSVAGSSALLGSSLCCPCQHCSLQLHRGCIPGRGGSSGCKL